MGQQAGTITTVGGLKVSASPRLITTKACWVDSSGCSRGARAVPLSLNGVGHKGVITGRLELFDVAVKR